MGDRTDAELVAARDFEALYRRHSDWVVSLAYRFCGNEPDALDVLQDTFTYVWRKLPDLELTARFTTFLYPAVRNLSLDRIRKRKQHEPLPDTLAATDGYPDEVRAMLKGLPVEQQEVVALRFADGFTLQEIADALAIPLGTVKSRLHNALRALEERIEKPGDRGAGA